VRERNKRGKAEEEFVCTKREQVSPLTQKGNNFIFVIRLDGFLKGNKSVAKEKLQ